MHIDSYQKHTRLMTLKEGIVGVFRINFLFLVGGLVFSCLNLTKLTLI